MNMNGLSTIFPLSQNHIISLSHYLSLLFVHPKPVLPHPKPHGGKQFRNQVWAVCAKGMQKAMKSMKSVKLAKTKVKATKDTRSL
jgi:hypothetical protein